MEAFVTPNGKTVSHSITTTDTQMTDDMKDDNEEVENAAKEMAAKRVIEGYLATEPPVKQFVIAFDSGAKGTRYHAIGEKYGVMYAEDALQFESKEEAQECIDENEYSAWVEELY